MSEKTYVSRDRWPVWLWLFFLFISGSLTIAVEAALGNTLAWITFLLQFLLAFWGASSTPLSISVDQQWLYVGEAAIEREFITRVLILDAPQMSLIRGRDANPLCWMAIRFWVSTGVKIEINDPLDPTPYWLVSTKRATELSEALLNG